ncbi:MAG TPA: hypothetical protein VF733_04045 [Candidatus Saccharimonadales bacterium]
MKQQIVAGGYLEIPTVKELSENIGHNFDDAIRDLYRGLDFTAVQGLNPNNSNPFSIQNIMSSGYSWSIKIIAVSLSAAASVAAYDSESTVYPPINTATSAVFGGKNEAVMFFSANQCVIKDQSAITLVATAGFVTAYRIWAQQVPTEMQGKL